jgi:chitinase
MPLKKGSSQKTISRNIGELVGAYKEKGRIGTSKPKSKAAAVKQAAAIAYEKAGKSRKMSKGGAMGPVRVVKKKDGNRPVKIY